MTGLLCFLLLVSFVVWLWSVRRLQRTKRAAAAAYRQTVLHVILECERAAARREGRAAKFPMTYEEMYA
jgi:hypothetical protein